VTSHDEPGLDLERVVFFSDAVFAIAITLLVLEIQLPDLPPHASADAILAALSDTMPRIFAWVLSFATIGLYWLAHWRKYRHIERVDDRLAALNLVLLGCIAFVPFPTALIGQHGDQWPSVVLYAVTLSVAGLLGTAGWAYAWRARLVRPDVTFRDLRLAALRGVAVPVVMLTSLVILPIIGPAVVELTWLLIFPVQLALNRVVARRDEAARSAGPEVET
jgi:uncharacterized membrane protein